MTPEILLTIAIAIGGIAVSYHIAHRSGAFGHPQFKIRFGDQYEPEGYREPIALLFGIPRNVKEAKYIAFPVPVTLGDHSKPLNDVWVQVSLPNGRDASRVPALAERAFDWLTASGRRRTTIPAGARNFIEHEMAVLRPNQGLGLLEPLVYDREEIAEPPQRPEGVRLEELRVHVRASNHPGTHATVLFHTVWSDSLEELQKVAGIVGIAARIQRRLVTIPVRPGLIWVPPLRRWLYRRVLICQLDFEFRHRDVVLNVPGKSHRESQSVDFLPYYLAADDMKPEDSS